MDGLCNIFKNDDMVIDCKNAIDLKDAYIKNQLMQGEEVNLDHALDNAVLGRIKKKRE